MSKFPSRKLAFALRTPSQAVSPLLPTRCPKPISPIAAAAAAAAAAAGYLQSGAVAAVGVVSARRHSCLAATSSTKLAPPTSHHPSISPSPSSSPSSSSSPSFSARPVPRYHQSASLLRQSAPSNRVSILARHFSSSPSAMSYAKAPSEYSVRKVGQPNTLEFRAYIERDGQPVSPFHDIPLYANEQQTILNMVVEIPRWTNAKLETWEDPNVVHPETKAKGDNDPLDVCEIGELVGYCGQVKQVKLNDIEDVERHLPGLLRATNEWFRIYKIPDGKPENQFAFSGECKNKKYAMEVVHECADAWDKLMSGKSSRGDISLANTTSEQSPDRVDANQVSAIPPHQELAPAPIDGSVDKWFFISGAAV
ncbi:inorganic pyrophosphatase [Histoplasma capsulatum]|uniref:inorganic diphosphatase n=1 Tax=Ajellomyces capsulatus TaxID=5037 RepID=A0A8A1M806_AJECA|nr:inorganic pyrophosphatase [Histoplasma capsulatum]